MLLRAKLAARASRTAGCCIAVLAIFFITDGIATHAAAQDNAPAAKQDKPATATGDIAELFEYITKEKVKLGQAEAQAEDKALEQLIANETKARNAIAPSAQSVDEQIKQKLLAFKPEADRQNAVADALIEDWNGECDVKRVGKLPPDKAKACQEKRVEVDKAANAIREQVKKAAIAYVGPGLLDIKQRQDKGLAEIDERIKQAKKTLDEARARATQIRKYLDEAWTRTRSLCLEASDKAAASGDAYWRERLSYCMSKGWDNTKKDLLPLAEIKPPFSSSPNQ